MFVCAEYHVMCECSPSPTHPIVYDIAYIHVYYIISFFQMTSSNLAVCFAPSLFNMGGPRNISQTPSPRRNRKNPGIPDARELMEQKAAHECLAVMINECKKLFTVSIHF